MPETKETFDLGPKECSIQEHCAYIAELYADKDQEAIQSYMKSLSPSTVRKIQAHLVNAYSKQEQIR